MLTGSTMWKATLAAMALLATGPAAAQRSDRSGEMFGSRSEGRNVAGQFDYYALVLSWSPTHCATAQPREGDLQCGRTDGRRYGFVLHGLWPQHDRGWPEYCPTRARPFVPQPVIDNILDIMPSPRLAIHEYKKHGTCSGMDPAQYFAESRKLFTRIKIPAAYINPFENRMVAPDDLMEEFLAANPGLKPDMLAISCGGAGNRLREIRVCFNRSGDFRACGRNEDQRKLCSASRMFVPPVRTTKVEPETADEKRNVRAPLPGPRLIPGVGR